MSCLKGRVALVTGASRGIGEEVARLFAQNGAHVIAIARSFDNLSEPTTQQLHCDGDITFETFDVSNVTLINKLAEKIADKWGRLDILVGNAAIHEVETPLHLVSPETWRQTFAVNLDANWQLICAFDALLKQSDAGRAIFVTSRASEMKLPNVGAYSASKAALETMVRSYAAELEATPVRVNLLDPGPVRTRMRALAEPDEDPTKLPTPKDVAPLFVKMAEATYLESGKTVRFMKLGLRKRLRQFASDIKHGRF